MDGADAADETPTSQSFSAAMVAMQHAENETPTSQSVSAMVAMQHAENETPTSQSVSAMVAMQHAENDQMMLSGGEAQPLYDENGVPEFFIPPAGLGT